jgi:hypothetical protein
MSTTGPDFDLAVEALPRLMLLLLSLLEVEVGRGEEGGVSTDAVALTDASAVAETTVGAPRLAALLPPLR